MKRLIIFIIILLTTACHALTNINQAQLHQNITSNATERQIPKMYRIDPLPNLPIQAEAAILINQATGDILFEKEATKTLPVASMSKIMTELIILEALQEETISWDDSVSISDYAYTISRQPGFASVQLDKGQTYTVKELFHAMAIHSANGATIALAEAVSGNEKDFVKLMNQKAKQLHLHHTNFVNSTGLTNKDLQNQHPTGSINDTNEMSAKDLATLTTYIIEQFPNILQITEMPEFEFKDETYENSNWMLPETSVDFSDEDITFPGVDGFKTGFTRDAGYGFTGAVEINGIRFISVIIGTENLEDRFIETKLLYETITKQLRD